MKELLQRKGLEVMEVYRNGPRYWVGRVRDTQGGYSVLKAVIDNTAWIDQLTGEAYVPANQLRIEMAVLAGLQRQAGQLAGGTPAILDQSLADSPWLQREHVGGQGLAAGPGPFLFDARVYEPAVKTALIEFILSLQRLSPHLQGELAHLQRVRRISVAQFLRNDIDRPSDWLAPYSSSIRRYILDRQELYDAQIGTLVHGQMYPPHLYWREGVISLIDWESTRFGNALQDFVSVWIRAFDDPDWQRTFVAQLQDRGLLLDATQQELWNIEVLLQAGGNLNYLYWSRLEAEVERRRAAQALTRQIGAIVGQAI